MAQKLQEESDLRVAMDTFGRFLHQNKDECDLNPVDKSYPFVYLMFLCVTGVTEAGIDAMNPTTKEEFEELESAISKKITLYTKSTHFPAFAEDLIRNICANCKYNIYLHSGNLTYVTSWHY